MTFARVEMLFLIWTAPLLALVLAYGMRRRRKALSRFASRNSLSVLTPTLSPRRRWTKGGLVLAALAAMAVALSGPRYGFHWQEIERRGIDILIALDCSRSMLAQDLQPTRLDRAKREVMDLLSMLQGDRVGLVAFSGTAFLQCPLTLDYTAFHLFLDVLSPDYLPVGGTDITGALTVARDSFDPQSPAEKAVILITDGENTGQDDPVAAARKLDENGIKLFCIGVGGTEGVPVPDPDGGFKKDAAGGIVMTRLDEKTLEQMALLTGGTYVRSVAGDMDLDVIYGKEIRGKMEATELAGGRKQVWEDRYQWFLARAILCVVMDLMLRPIRRSNTAVIGCLLCVLPGILSPPSLVAGPLEDGIEAYRAGAYEKALNRFIDAQLDAPDRPDILYNLGNTYYKLGDYEAALTHYGQVLEKDPAGLKEKALYNKGNAHFRKKDYNAAIEAYEAALKIDPDDQQAVENLQFVRKVMEQQQQQQGQSQKNGDQEKGEKEKQADNSQPEDRESQDKAPEDARNDRPSETPPEEKGDVPEPGPEFGDDMAQGAQSPPQPEEKADEENRRKTASTESPDAPPDDAERQAAARALNRLQDQPGKALMAPSPHHGRPAVEKDW